MSLDGGKTWITLKTFPHDAGLLASGTCSTCGYTSPLAPQPTEEPAPEDTYRYVSISDTQHAHQVSHDGGVTWENESVSSHSEDSLAGKGACPQCGFTKKSSDPGTKTDPKEKTSDSQTKGASEAALDNADRRKDSYGGHYYIIVDESVRWDVAADAAEEAGGYLAVINSKEEEQFITGLSDSQDTLWIGAFCLDTGWMWISAEDWGYENWQSGYPVDESANPCAAFSGSDWVNLPMEESAAIDGFIVEFDSADDVNAIAINLDSAIQTKKAAVEEIPAAIDVPDAPAEDVEEEAEEQGGVSLATLIVVLAVVVVGAGIVYMLLPKKKGNSQKTEEKE